MKAFPFGRFDAVVPVSSAVSKLKDEIVSFKALTRTYASSSLGTRLSTVLIKLLADSVC